MNKNITTIVFDMGNVLIHFRPDMFAARLPLSQAEQQQLIDAIFVPEIWGPTDEGTVSKREVYDYATARLPEYLHRYAHELIYNWKYPLIPVEGMGDVVRACKKKGYRLLLLSNAGYDQPEYFMRVPGNECFEGTVISAYERIVKPDLRLYQILIDRFDLDPSVCLFIDDSPANIAAGKKAGFETYLFDGDVQKLREYLEI